MVSCSLVLNFLLQCVSWCGSEGLAQAGHAVRTSWRCWTEGFAGNSGWEEPSELARGQIFEPVPIRGEVRSVLVCMSLRHRLP